MKLLEFVFMKLIGNFRGLFFVYGEKKKTLPRRDDGAILRFELDAILIFFHDRFRRVIFGDFDGLFGMYWKNL